MRITVVGPADLTRDQTRAYAEYRVFATLARFGRMVRSATLSLEHGRMAASSGVTCVIEVDLGERNVLRFRTTDRQASAAIDRTARRAQRAIESRDRATG